MNHFVFVYYLMTFFSGVLSSLLVLFLHHRFRTLLLKSFFLFLMSLTVLEMLYLIVIYLQVYQHRVTVYPRLELVILISLVDLFLIYKTGDLVSRVIVSLNKVFLFVISFFWGVLIFLTIPAGFIFSPGRASDFRDICFALYFILLFISVYINKADLKPVILDGFLWFLKLIIFVLPIVIAAVFIKGFSIFRIFPQGAFSFSLIFLIFNLIVINKIKKFYTSGPEEKNGNSAARYGLTKREIEIINFVQSGLSNRQIAERLFISPKTVGNHLYSIFKKTGVQNRYELITLR